MATFWYGATVPPASGVLPILSCRMLADPLAAPVLDHERGEERGNAPQRRALVEADVLEEPDREVAARELGYLVEQVDRDTRESAFDALAVLQGFIVESLAIATYEPFLGIADTYPGARQAFATALADERYHVDWITRYLRLRYFDAVDEFLGLAGRVNTQGVDCVGGTMMNIASYLDVVGLSGADCAAGMLDGYAGLL